MAENTPTPDADRILAEHYLADANERLRYQHEFSQAAFKALLLVNGGAIVATLTYAGNVMKGAGAATLKTAIALYALGLVATLFAHLAAYFSQGQILDHTWDQAFRHLGVESSRPTPKAGATGTALIWAAVICATLALLAFVGGSWSAIEALSITPKRP